MTRRTSRARTSRVFLHIGAPVAGSTYLRECLARHRRKLTRYGVLYPPSHLGHDGGHLGAVLDVLDLSGGDHAPTTGAWDRLAESARDWRRGTVVISHELLAGASEEQIDRIVGSFGNAEVHVVYAARDLARQIPLAWQEWVRGGGTATFEGYTNRIVEHGEHRLSQVFWSTHALDDVLARWAAYVPAGRIHLLPLPQDHGRSSVVWDRFAQTIGLNPRKFKVGSDEHAKPLSKVANEVLRLLNAEITDHPTPRGIDRVRSVLEKQPGPPAEVASTHEVHLRDEAARMIAAVEGAGYAVAGDLTDLVPARDSFTDQEPAGVSQDDVAATQTRLIAALIANDSGPAGFRRRALSWLSGLRPART